MIRQPDAWKAPALPIELRSRWKTLFGAADLFGGFTSLPARFPFFRGRHWIKNLVAGMKHPVGPAALAIIVADRVVDTPADLAEIVIAVPVSLDDPLRRADADDFSAAWVIFLTLQERLYDELCHANHVGITTRGLEDRMEASRLA